MAETVCRQGLLDAQSSLGALFHFLLDAYHFFCWVHMSFIFLLGAHVIYSPFLFQVGFKNLPKGDRVSLNKEEVVRLIRDGFISAAERDIYTGDAVHISVITKDGVESVKYPLRRD